LRLNGTLVTTGSNGEFNLNGVAYIGDTLVASATGFAGSGNVVITYVDADAGVITIGLTRTFTVTFHRYDGTDALHGVIEVELGDRLGDVINGTVIADVTHILGVPGIPGHAFWGWFTDNALNSSGRTNATSGRRRPLVTDRGIGMDTVLTVDLFDEYSNFNLYAIWSLWGDVNDDDLVDHVDLDDLRLFVMGVPGMRLNIMAANVVVNFRPDGSPYVDHVDLDDLRLYIMGVPGTVLGRSPN